MTTTRSTLEAGAGAGEGGAPGPALALVLDHPPASDAARAKLLDILGWLMGRGASHVTLVGAGAFAAPAALQGRTTLLEAGRGRAAVAEAVAALIAAKSALTQESLGAGIERLAGPSPDLILLVGENARLDDSFCWNAAYAELCLLPAPWEALSEADVSRALADFAGRDRRFGALGPSPA